LVNHPTEGRFFDLRCRTPRGVPGPPWGWGVFGVIFGVSFGSRFRPPPRCSV
jgi:hypothetical protein